MIVRAACDIAAGTELLWAYLEPDTKDRQERFQKEWAFKCTCALCTIREKTPAKILKRRDALTSDLEPILHRLVLSDASSTLLNDDIGRATRLLNALESTFKVPATEVPRLELWRPWVSLARSMTQKENLERQVSGCIKALEALGFVISGGDPPFSAARSPFRSVRWGLVVDEVNEMFMCLWRAYAAVAPWMAEAAENATKMAFMLCLGSEEQFDKLIRPVFKTAMANPDYFRKAARVKAQLGL